MRALTALLLTLCSLSALAATPPLAPLQTLAKYGARVSALVVRLDNGTALASIDDRLALTPASVSKLYVAAAALRQWGPDYRFTTRFLGTGPVKNGVLEGDLIFAGAGDPALTNEQLFILTRRLAERGIHEVKGKLIIDASYFGRIACTTDDRCAARHASHNAYDALLSSAAVNFANAELVVMPASSAGKPASVRIAPVNIPTIRVVNEVKTGPASSGWAVGIERRTEHGRDVFIARGSVPAGANPKRYWRALGHPDAATAGLLESLLSESGIRIDGGVNIDHSGTTQGLTLARIQGQPLWLQLRRMLTWSNNYMADTFTLDLLRTTRTPPLKLRDGGLLLTRTGRALEASSGLWSTTEPPRLKLESGSGLTTSSKASARDLVALLTGMYRQAGLFPSFLGALTVPGYTPVDMLKDPGDGAWMHAIAAKTGSLERPHSVFALAGYARLADGHWGAFAILINGTKNYEVPLGTAIDATRAALTPLLETPPKAHAPDRNRIPTKQTTRFENQ